MTDTTTVTLKHYLVSSPEIATELDTGHHEYGSCVAYVEASSERKAKSLAIKLPEFSAWVQHQRDNEGSPFTGLEVYESKCDHGVCYCDKCNGTCQQCETDHYNDLKADALSY